MLQKAAATFLITLAAVVGQPDIRSAVADRVMNLGRDAPWKPVASIAVRFPTHHPQGMVTHDAPLARAYAHRTVTLLDGVVVDEQREAGA